VIKTQRGLPGNLLTGALISNDPISENKDQQLINYIMILKTSSIDI
jgi:hypothetical protein